MNDYVALAAAARTGGGLVDAARVGVLRDLAAERFELVPPDPRPLAVRLDAAAGLVLDAGEALADVLERLFDRGWVPPEMDAEVAAVMAGWRLVSGDLCLGGEAVAG